MASEASEAFDEKYLTAEQAFRQKVFPLHNRERRLREMIRQNVELTDEERQERYMAEYRRIEQEFERHADEHVGAALNMRSELAGKVHAGAGAQFSQHLAALASTPDEKLPELLSTAERTGSKDLARAVAQTALERNKFGVFQKWADSDPQTAEALKRLRSMPEPERVATRTKALKPIKADALRLAPTHEDHRRAREEAEKKARPRKEFFNLPRRRAGGRIA